MKKKWNQSWKILLLFLISLLCGNKQIKAAPNLLKPLISSQNNSIPLGSQIPSTYVNKYNDDGSVDFLGSGWEMVTSFNSTNVNWDFNKNNRHYKITYCGDPAGKYPLSSFKVNDITDPNNLTSYIYVYDNQGNGITSAYTVLADSDNLVARVANRSLEFFNRTASTTLYQKPSKYGKAIAVLQKYETCYFSEIVDVNEAGILQHYLTYTEKTKAKSNVQIGSLRDTDLSIFGHDGVRYENISDDTEPGDNYSPGDIVDIIKGAEKKVYVSSSSDSIPNILLTANIHYIDVTGKTVPTGGWKPSDGVEISEKKQVISTQKDSMALSYALSWDHHNYQAVGASPEINPSTNQFVFPSSIVVNAIKTDFKVLFDGPTQYALNWRFKTDINKWKNANNFTENQLISIEEPAYADDSSVISSDYISYLANNQSFNIPFTEEVVSTGELSQNNTSDYYMYLSKLDRTSIRAVPNFDFGINQVNQQSNYFLAKSVAAPTQSDLNLDCQLDHQTPVTGNPIGNYLTNPDGSKARALVITDQPALPNTHWRLEASMSKFVDTNNTALNLEPSPTITLKSNKMNLKGIDDTGTASSAATWRKSVSPSVATDPVITANNLATVVLFGQNGSSSAVGSWLLDFGHSESAVLNFSPKNLKKIVASSRNLRATITWTLTVATP